MEKAQEDYKKKKEGKDKKEKEEEKEEEKKEGKEEKSDELKAPTWEEIVAAAKEKNILLSATANFIPFGAKDDEKNTPFLFHHATYFGFGVAYVEVELDLLTGETLILDASILYDAGQSLNTTIDIGQAQGAFVFGLGYFLTEEVLTSPEGKLISYDTWEYKPPSVYEIPQKFTVELLKDSKFAKGVNGMKGIGEPPLILASNAVSAIKNAIFGSRKERGKAGLFKMDFPATVDRIVDATEVSEKDFQE